MPDPDPIKRGDTWPPLYGLALDDLGGLLPLPDADYSVLLAKSGTVLIEGTVVPIDGGTILANGSTANWSYEWAAGDTDHVGEYATELEIHWDDGASPPKVQTVPNTGGVKLTIEQDQADAS